MHQVYRLCGAGWSVMGRPKPALARPMRSATPILCWASFIQL